MTNSHTLLESLKKVFVKYNPMGFNEYKKKNQYDTQALKILNQFDKYQSAKQVEEDLDFMFFEEYHDHDMDCGDLAKEIYSLKQRNESFELEKNDVDTSDIHIGGIYEHYKGKTYKVHEIVRHSETLEKLVMYECLYENELGKMWVRPIKMFAGNVEFEGVEKKRFSLIHK